MIGITLADITERLDFSNRLYYASRSEISAAPYWSNSRASASMSDYVSQAETNREIRSAEVDISVGCAKVGRLASWQLGDPQLRL
jgi:hypothetical protein